MPKEIDNHKTTVKEEEDPDKWKEEKINEPEVEINQKNNTGHEGIFYLFNKNNSNMYDWKQLWWLNNRDNVDRDKSHVWYTEKVST